MVENHFVTVRIYCVVEGIAVHANVKFFDVFLYPQGLFSCSCSFRSVPLIYGMVDGVLDKCKGVPAHQRMLYLGTVCKIHLGSSFVTLGTDWLRDCGSCQCQFLWCLSLLPRSFLLSFSFSNHNSTTSLLLEWWMSILAIERGFQRTNECVILQKLLRVKVLHDNWFLHMRYILIKGRIVSLEVLGVLTLPLFDWGGILFQCV